MKKTYVKYFFLLVLVVVAAIFLWPKSCSTNGFFGSECDCVGFETDMVYELSGDEWVGDKQSFCIGYRDFYAFRE
jgi:hypothetical protein